MASAESGKEDAPVGPVAGTTAQFVNLSSVIDYSKVSVLNADSKCSNLKSVLKSEAGAVLASDPDVDHQLLVFIPFMEAVKLHGVCFTALTTSSTDAKASGPKNVKLFNGGSSLDFDGAASNPATQAVRHPHPTPPPGGCTALM